MTDLTVPDIELTAEIEVEYDRTGKHLRATRTDPAEYPETHVRRCCVKVLGMEIVKDFDDLPEFIQASVLDYIEDEESAERRR